MLIVSDGTDPDAAESWEHVSVRACRSNGHSRVPTWREMCFVKNLCWSDDETVIQYHPRRSDYINRHPHVLHLWRPLKAEIPMPPLEFV